MEFHIEYQKCKKCEKKEYCRECENNLTEKLLLEPEIRNVNLQMDRHTLGLDSELELPELETLLQKYQIVVK